MIVTIMKKFDKSKKLLKIIDFKITVNDSFV